MNESDVYYLKVAIASACFNLAFAVMIDAETQEIEKVLLRLLKILRKIRNKEGLSEDEKKIIAWAKRCAH